MFKFDKDIIYTLRGPRQVGKTTLLKYLISDFLDKGVDPRRLFYYTCDPVNNPKELINIINKYLDAIRPDANERAYIFLDEISSLKDWQRAIKYLWDTGKLKNVTVILTGSHTLDIRKAYERLPGRRGEFFDVPDKILLPMKFVEYAETINHDIRGVMNRLNLIKIKNREHIILEIIQGIIPDEINELSLYKKELDLLFNQYLLTGGIPRVIDGYLKTGRISEGVYRTYIDVVCGDFARWNIRETYLRQVVRRIIDTLGNPVGWNALKQGTDIAHHNTIINYVNVLEESFIVY